MLIRFFRNKEYAEQFLDGKIFCNSLNSFRNYPNTRLNGAELAKDKCTDLFEGSVQLLREYFPYKEFLSHIGCDPNLVFSEYSKAHICCFSSIGNTIPNNMEQFGEWCVLIYDFKTFEKKLKNALTSERNIYYLYGGVEYYYPTINGKQFNNNGNAVVFSLDGLRIYFDKHDSNAFIKRDAFCKFMRFKNQQEWRLFLYKESYSLEAEILILDDLHDCCVLCQVSDANSEIRRIQRDYPIVNTSQTRIKGNITRERLNEKIIEKNPWGHIYFILGSKEVKTKEINSLYKGLKIKRVNEPNHATVRGFF